VKRKNLPDAIAPLKNTAESLACQQLQGRQPYVRLPFESRLGSGQQSSHQSLSSPSQAWPQAPPQLIRTIPTAINKAISTTRKILLFFINNSCLRRGEL